MHIMSNAQEIIPLASTLGAEVRVGDVRALDASRRELLRDALTEHLVLLIRGQRLDDDALVEFGKTFGELDVAPMSYTVGHQERRRPEVLIVSNVKEGGVPIGVLGDAEVVWHSDNSYRETPLAATMLYAVELPPAGGETGFLNMYHALETMPLALRAAVEQRRLKHDATYNSAGQLRRGFAPTSDVRQAPGPWHPIIRTHPRSGHDALYLGRRPNAYIDGLSVDESEDLIDALWSHATRAQYAWHHTWRPGDILVWDNRCVMHRRNPFDPQSRRVMHRVQCSGERPVRDPSAARRGVHPRARAMG
jgi:taurine dioxygenase